MLISTEQLELGAVEFRESFPPGSVAFEDQNLRQVGQLDVAGKAELIAGSSGEIRVFGTLRAEVEADCNRCLEPFRFPVNSPFQLTYAPVAQSRVTGEVEIEEAGSEVGFYEGAGILLEDVAREQILLTLPYQMICRKDCKGLCPHCGQNRNLATCGCQEKLLESRWRGLDGLKR